MNLLVNDIAKVASPIRQFDGEGFGGEGVGQREFKKAMQEVIEFCPRFSSGGVAPNLLSVWGRPARNGIYAGTAIAVQSEFEEVGEDEIRKRTEIAL